MIPVTVLGQQEAEAARVAQVGAAKGKKKDRREADADTMAHEQARGAIYGADGEPGDVGKAHGDAGIHQGPAQPMTPRQIHPQDFQRAYDSPGHAAASPGYQPPNTMPADAPGAPYPRHVDLRGSTALAVPIRPDGAPGGRQ